MAVTVLLIRHAPHGQLGRTLSGRTAGLALSPEGVAHAERLGAWLARRPIDRLQASPLDRTLQTAQAIAAATGLSVDPVEALNEVDFGDWTGKTFADLDHDPAWARWNEARSSAASPGGETMAAAQSRLVAHLRSAARDHDGESVAMVSHCDVIRAGVAWGLGLSLDDMLRFDIDPGSVTRIVLGDWGARVLSVNEGTW